MRLFLSVNIGRLPPVPDPANSRAGIDFYGFQVFWEEIWLHQKKKLIYKSWEKTRQNFFYCGLVISTPQNRLRGPSDYWGFCFYSKSVCMRAMCLCRKPHGVWVPYSHAVVLIGDYFYKLMTLLWWNINYGYSFRETEREKKSFVSHHWKCQY